MNNTVCLRILLIDDGEFNEPSGVAVMPNGDIAVADRRNKRVQVFYPSGRFKFKFSTNKEPFSITVDSMFNIAIGTVKRSIEVYKRTGEPIGQWSLGPCMERVAAIWLIYNSKDELLVSDPTDHKIKYFTSKGKMFYQFEPTGPGDIAVTPTDITSDPDTGCIVIADGLNHTLNLYTERGVFQTMLVGPTDGIGSVQSVVITPKGHLVVTEFSNNGPHCMKIFRYKDCECHRTRPASSKRRTPTPKQ